MCCAVIVPVLCLLWAARRCLPRTLTWRARRRSASARQCCSTRCCGASGWMRCARACVCVWWQGGGQGEAGRRAGRQPRQGVAGQGRAMLPACHRPVARCRAGPPALTPVRRALGAARRPRLQQETDKSRQDLLRLVMRLIVGGGLPAAPPRPARLRPLPSNCPPPRPQPCRLQPVLPVPACLPLTWRRPTPPRAPPPPRSGQRGGSAGGG